jgi:hypothetical protein
MGSTSSPIGSAFPLPYPLPEPEFFRCLSLSKADSGATSQKWVRQAHPPDGFTLHPSAA